MSPPNVLGRLDIGGAELANPTMGGLISRVLEQQAQLADHMINQSLLTELVKQFVKAERDLADAHAAVVALSRTDALTGIANRRWFDESLSMELARAQRGTSPVGLLLMDIDCFKLFNDNYGHASGDDCLIQVARAVHSVVKRPPDLAARYGGEELVCLLPGTDRDGVARVGASILDAVRGLAIPHAHSPAAPVVTLSIGGISLPGDPTLTAKTLIEAADTALYYSKEHGRNSLTMG